MEKKVSVIIPVYNVEKYLEECIQSVLKQTYKNLEIILVDDGSKDNSGNICDEYAKRDERIKVIHKKNGGLSDARNAGIDICTGEYIAFLDSDDFIEEDMYEFLVKNLEKAKADISICQVYYVYKNAKQTTHTPNVYLEMNSSEAIKYVNMLGYYTVAAYDKLYKREIFENIRYPVGKVNEDWYIICQVLDKANKIVYSSEPKYNYRKRRGSITDDKKINLGMMDASKQCLEFVEQKYPENTEIATQMYIYASMNTYNTIKAKTKEAKALRKKIKQEIKKRYKTIKLQNYNRQSEIKNLQIKLFVFCPMICNIVYKFYEGTKEQKCD